MTNLLMIIYLVMYSIFVFVLVVWASTDPRFKHVRQFHLGVSVVCFVVVCYLSWPVLTERLATLVYHQLTDYEVRHPACLTMAYPLANGSFVLTLPPCNPWDQGSWLKNWRHVMGPWYSSLVPFWTPQRDRDYDDDDKPEFDEQ
ncbi:hypothetical protein F5X68DRAFT_227319 [Plectosphaerella plurivora]|uniref:Uncharacterized protein n=1 Tax=Plectosphaerella plurivora TaxID=936078 RepID=A0A9P8VIV3_9PEZI|nr:hypothetical protein F5X68DRAFT_227319 [Plectosphaerella plurivora]